MARINLRLVFGLSAAVVALAVYFALGAGSASAHPGHPGDIHQDVSAAPASCESVGLATIPGTDLCTHGPDLAPPGVTAAEADAPEAFTSAANQAVCDDNGTSGQRVQVVYARGSDRPDQYSDYASSFRAWSAAADQIYQKSAEKTGGERYIRFVHDSNCNISILRLTLTPSGDDNFDNMVNEMMSMGYDDPDRRYLVYLDSSSPYYCGQGTLWLDDSPGLSNYNNTFNGISAVFSGCWGDGQTAAHELGHNFGAVQISSPHSTGSGYFHCTDEYDVMCYDDFSGKPLTYPCGNYSSEFLLDCRNDDYFHTNPPTGNYLRTHWNVANSGFLGKELNSSTLSLDKEKSKYNGWVMATMTGFTPGYYINVKWPGNILLGQVKADSEGTGTVMFRTPLSPLGDYQVRASNSIGESATATLRVIPRIMLNSADDETDYAGPTGESVRVYFYGFSAGERVQIQWYTESGSSYQVLKTITIADNGRGSIIVSVPDNATTGSHMIRGKVIGVSRSASTTFTVTGPGAAEEPTATPTAEPTETATPEPTVTLEPTTEPTQELPTETATPEPTVEEPTPEPTETVEPTPTEEPTEEPAPTETPTPEPTATTEAVIEEEAAP